MSKWAETKVTSGKNEGGGGGGSKPLLDNVQKKDKKRFFSLDIFPNEHLPVVDTQPDTAANAKSPWRSHTSRHGGETQSTGGYTELL